MCECVCVCLSECLCVSVSVCVCVCVTLFGVRDDETYLLKIPMLMRAEAVEF